MTISVVTRNASNQRIRTEDRRVFSWAGSNLTSLVHTSNLVVEGIDTTNHTYRVDSDYFAKRKVNARLPELARDKLISHAFSRWQGDSKSYVSWKPSVFSSGCITTPCSSLGDSMSFVTPPVGVCEGVAQTQARLNARDQKVNLAQAFGERKQLANLAASTINRIVTAYRALRRGNIPNALRALGQRPRSRLRATDIGSQWLEIQYGWKPLLSDVYGVMQALKPADDRLLFSAVGRGRWVDNRVTTRVSADKSQRRIDQGTNWRKARTKLDFSVSDSALLTASQLGLSDPATLAWELLPFSFVVDWFLPVGDYIAGLSALSGLTFLGGSTSTKTYNGIESAGFSQRVGNPVSWVVASGIKCPYQVRLIRTVHVTVPGPSLAVKNPLSFTHVANAMALLQMVFGRGKKPSIRGV